MTLRTRLRGEVYSRKGQLERVFYSLNEFIVNRGISGVLSTLEVMMKLLLLLLQVVVS